MMEVEKINEVAFFISLQGAAKMPAELSRYRAGSVNYYLKVSNENRNT